VTLQHHLEVRSQNVNWSFTNRGPHSITEPLKAQKKRCDTDPYVLKIPLTKAFGTYRNNTHGKLITNKYILHVEVFMNDMCLGKTSSFTDSLDLRIVDESGHNLGD
jgi:hypothetical protein